MIYAANNNFESNNTEMTFDDLLASIENDAVDYMPMNIFDVAKNVPQVTFYREYTLVNTDGEIIADDETAARLVAFAMSELCMNEEQINKCEIRRNGVKITVEEMTDDDRNSFARAGYFVN